MGRNQGSVWEESGFSLGGIRVQFGRKSGFSSVEIRVQLGRNQGLVMQDRNFVWYDQSSVW